MQSTRSLNYLNDRQKEKKKKREKEIHTSVWHAALWATMKKKFGTKTYEELPLSSQIYLF